MQNNENIDEWINWIEEAISKKHMKYYEFEDFKNIQEIGYGAFGKIFRANWKNFDHYLALKSFYNLNNITLKEIVYELKIQRDVDFHDNIIRFYGITKSDSGIENIINPTKNYLLVIEYADGRREEIISDTPSGYSDLYTECWNDEPNKRPYIHEVVNRLRIFSKLMANENLIPNSTKNGDIWSKLFRYLD
ncbi:unnamed protein product [Rhizophagus irregularis]|nr:unnamed protein product [Rhizophagus irregularis]